MVPLMGISASEDVTSTYGGIFHQDINNSNMSTTMPGNPLLGSLLCIIITEVQVLNCRLHELVDFGLCLVNPVQWAVRIRLAVWRQVKRPLPITMPLLVLRTDSFFNYHSKADVDGIEFIGGGFADEGTSVWPIRCSGIFCMHPREDAVYFEFGSRTEYREPTISTPVFTQSW